MLFQNLDRQLLLNSIGQQFKEARHGMHLSWRDITLRIGGQLSPGAYARWERAEVLAPLDKFIVACQVLNLSPATVLAKAESAAAVDYLKQIETNRAPRAPILDIPADEPVPELTQEQLEKYEMLSTARFTEAMGHLLLRVRLEKRLSRNDVVIRMKCGATIDAYRNWELGLRQATVDMDVRMCRALGTCPADTIRRAEAEALIVVDDS
ncbi:helix-turn-helix domain-containing protein [Amycolatopsis sp. NPDC059657]|uniref:helix-turn-helix domain-containing protein n=1 Tax=Amycolatopsis sp. NPDC059657 TaxID=3346899 RepID=UPI00366C8134